MKTLQEKIQELIALARSQYNTAEGERLRAVSEMNAQYQKGVRDTCHAFVKQLERLSPPATDGREWQEITGGWRLYANGEEVLTIWANRLRVEFDALNIESFLAIARDVEAMQQWIKEQGE